MTVLKSTSIFAAVFAVLTTSAAFAQQATAQGELQAVQSAAAQNGGGGDGFVDKAKAWADKHQIVERLNGDVDGWYPRLGGMTNQAESPKPSRARREAILNRR